MQYFKYIEQSGTDARLQGPPLVSGAMLYKPIAASEVPPTPVKQTRDLKLDTAFQKINEDEDALTPNSMSSRLADSAVEGLDEAIMHQELMFDQMSSRIVTSSSK